MNLYCHPSTLDKIKAGLPEYDGIDAEFMGRPHRNYINVVASDFIPERNWQDQWTPPKGDRFTQYDASDEAWMRPLGLGTVTKVDVGLLLMRVKEKFDKLVFDHLNVPPALLGCEMFFARSRLDMPLPSTAGMMKSTFC